ncbi:hypothetical protein [Poseidonibacter sp.]|uniref:hypothetical protein n=1 Tax=Poseidonibacter sp. TaxID=2321188 RepID=UPI003C7912A8
MTREDFIKTKGKDYSDWFGKGNTVDDMLSLEKFNKKECLEVIEDEYMILCIFDDCFEVIGYDGNEYTHSFSFKKN